MADTEQFIADVEMALYASKIVSYAQGYALMAATADLPGSTYIGPSGPGGSADRARGRSGACGRAIILASPSRPNATT